jgi:nucleoside-diphosphate-sugar epimerase
MNKAECIFLPGGAGLVGQNLIPRLKALGYTQIVVLDKHSKNVDVLRKLHPDIEIMEVDLSKPGAWQAEFSRADVVVMLQAQIGGLDYAEFERNNVHSTELILDAIKLHSKIRLVHISSSVVTSIVDDFYNRSKIAQEKIVLASGITCPILRPALMFGWFDRKHLGWLSRFMKKVPVFPIPGNGRYMRQPLYVGDFCNIVISCIENKGPSGIFNISGQEKIDYVDMITMIKKATHSPTQIVHIPYRLFYRLIWLWSCFDKNPPFTTQQLEALVAKDEFEVIDWPSIFHVKATSFETALSETFGHPVYSAVALDF